MDGFPNLLLKRLRPHYHRNRFRTYGGFVWDSLQGWRKVDYESIIGFLGGVMFAPLIVNRIGRRMTIFLALITFALIQFVFSVSPNWNVMLAIAPFCGAGIGIAETIVASLIIGHLKKRKR